MPGLDTLWFELGATRLKQSLMAICDVELVRFVLFAEDRLFLLSVNEPISQ